MAEETQAWERRPGEPLRWYNIFVTYYLGAGLSRSVRKAFLKYVEAVQPESLESAKSRRGIPGTWSNIAERWDWRERADAWEAEQTQAAMATVTQAARALRLLSLDAVTALALNLTSSRLAVQAAKEILDRSGLPAVTRIEAENKVAFTSDDMAKARDEVEKWNEARNPSSG